MKGTVIDRAADIVQRNGYLLGWMHEDTRQGIVAFLDPHTLKPGWNGKKIFGLVRFTAAEIKLFGSASDGATKILHRVREAEHTLLEDLGRSSDSKALKKIGISLALILIMLYPVVKLIA